MKYTGDLSLASSKAASGQLPSTDLSALFASTGEVARPEQANPPLIHTTPWRSHSWMTKRSRANSGEAGSGLRRFLASTMLMGAGTRSFIKVYQHGNSATMRWTRIIMSERDGIGGG